MQKKIPIYIDIESLLDLRQGYLATLGLPNEQIYEYIKSLEFLERKTDKFIYGDYEDYKKAITDGDVNLLMGSTITHMVAILISKINASINKNSIDGEARTPEIIVNYHPFNLLDEEIDMIKDALFVKLGQGCFIELISMPQSEVTPLFIKDSEFYGTYIYDFKKWINIHGESLQNFKEPEIEISFAPIMEEEPTEEELEEMKKIGLDDIFTFFELALSTSFKVSFLPTVFYSNCILAKDILDNYNDLIIKDVEERRKKMDISEEELNGYFSQSV